MRDYISPSQISTYLRCPAQFMFRYEEGLILPPKSALTRGKAVHKGQEVNYKQKIETKQDLPLDDVKDAVATEFEAAATETEWTPDEDKGKVKDDSISLAALYHKEVAPIVQPEFVEEEVFVEMPSGIKLKGYIDVVQEGGIIRDTKTTKQTPNAETLDKSLQISAYSFAYRAILGQEEAKVVLDYLVNTKTPKVVTMANTRTQAQINFFLSTAERVSAAIKAGIYYPNPDNFMCSKDNCGYWFECQKKFGGIKNG